jgi:hypothetical protein
MEWPMPHVDESEQDFIVRCKDDELLVSRFPIEAQRLAVLRGQFAKSQSTASLPPAQQEEPQMRHMEEPILGINTGFHR